MKRFMHISVIVTALLMACAAPGQAERFHGGGRGGWGWGWGPAVGIGLLGLGLWEASSPHYVYPYYPYAYPGPVVIQQPATEVYVQPAQQQSAESGYWYYCRDSQGYYPYVRQCPGGWMKVVPSPPPER